MAFTPNSRVYLLDTPLDNTYKNTIKFASLADQYNYFTGRIKHSFEGVTYQRKNNVVRVDKHVDDLWNVNYIAYQNTNFGKKWIYAFIVKMEYVSDRATDIFIETDVYQTWLFEAQLKESFVIREHVDDDTIGAHLVDEQLETGEYKLPFYEASGELEENFNILAVSDNSPLGNTDQIGNIYGGVVTGLTYFPFPNDATGITWLKATLNAYNSKPDAIVMIFTIPKMVIPNWDGVLGHPITTESPYGYKFKMIDKKLDNLDGYIPKNNKLFTHPYNFLYVSNNTGLSATYRYEDFAEIEGQANKMMFMVYGSPMPNTKIMFAPTNYKGSGSAACTEYGLTLEGFPLCSWTTDTYAAWFAQNGASMGVAIAGSVAAIGAGVFTGNAMAIGGGALGVFSQMAQFYKASIQPDQAKGQVGSGALQFGTNTLDFFIAKMVIKAEYAKRIDDFFTLYGYKVNTLKIPETSSRKNWNYIQTIDVNIVGSIPDEDMQRLKKAYNDGITLWHTTSHFLDYSQPNPII